MSEGEKMVWAAVFAVSLDLSNPPRGCFVPTEGSSDRWAEWEGARVHEAIEAAGHAVQHIREQRDSFAEGWEGYELLDLLDEMMEGGEG